MPGRRLLRHLCTPPWAWRRAFSRADLAAIERAIGSAESRYGGQICFAVEASLPLGDLWHGRDARERAVDVFAQRRIWDTEDRRGVLIYLLLAERRVEIVADRGAAQQLGDAACADICAAMVASFREHRFLDGVLAGIEGVGKRLGALPASGVVDLGLPDAPVIL